MINPQKFNPDTSVQGRAVYDAGLRSYMLSIYNYLAMGLGLAGLISYALVAYFPNILMQLASSMPLWIGLNIGILVVGWKSPKLIMGGSVARAHTFYWLYCALWGVAISPLIVVALQFQGGGYIVAKAFFISASMFAGASLYGYVTKRDLSGLGRFFMLASIGLIVAMVVNMFFPSRTYSLIVSSAAVLLFAGVTAWETQTIRNYYFVHKGDKKQLAIFGAFQLFGSFAVMFINVLRIMLLSRN